MSPLQCSMVLLGDFEAMRRDWNARNLADRPGMSRQHTFNKQTQDTAEGRMSIVRELNGLVVFLSVLLACVTYLRLSNVRDVGQTRDKANRLNEAIRDLDIKFHNHDNFPSQWGKFPTGPRKRSPIFARCLFCWLLEVSFTS